MSAPQPYLSSLADRTGWTEGQILAFVGAVLGAGCTAALIAALRTVDAVFDALPGARFED